MLSSFLLGAVIVWPAGTQIIERAPVPSAKGPRELVLWMIKPIRYENEPRNCGTSVYGDYWRGAVQLSLVDSAAQEIIDSVTLPSELRVPFFVDDTVWHIPAGRSGKPKIIHLQDMTGEGAAAQFPIFSHAGCGIVYTAVAGYSEKLDRAMLYRIHGEIDDETWALQVFKRRPVRPGHWDFVWTPARESLEYIHERVDFDPENQLFVNNPELVPAPHFPKFLWPHSRIIEQQLIEDRLLLVLWMNNPRYSKNSFEHVGFSECWIGSAHLSLLDPADNRIINTIDLPADFPIPVPRSTSHGRILEMQDLTGEGFKGQFSLRKHMNSFYNETRIYGFSPTQNRLISYPFLNGDKEEWSIPQVFRKPQTRPGMWQGVRFEVLGEAPIFDDVTFDPTRQLFIRNVKISKQKKP